MSNERDSLNQNLENLKQRIIIAAKNSGRDPQEIKIVAVTKTIEPKRIIEIIDCGILNLGENRVQELCEKYDIIKRECNWHLIGHLQTNKVKYIIDKVTLIHSVDSMELVKELQLRAGRINRVIEILIQVNISGEETKFGIRPHEVKDFILSVSKFQNIKVKGLMTIAPNTYDKDRIRDVFKNLNKIFIDIKQENIDNINMEILSMGMSNDFEIAIEEGAHMIRVGSLIFGSRA
jgi:pyridoxal phosphate enzyme (YggS family)